MTSKLRCSNHGKPVVCSDCPNGSYFTAGKQAVTSQPWKARCKHVTSTPSRRVYKPHPVPNLPSPNFLKKSFLSSLLKTSDSDLMFSVSEPAKILLKTSDVLSLWILPLSL
jgi:hypothetical protein